MSHISCWYILFLMYILYIQRVPCYLCVQPAVAHWWWTPTTLTSRMESPQDSVNIWVPVLLLCVSPKWCIVYGDHSGVTVGAELLYVVSLHTVQFHPGETEAILWVADAAWQRAQSHGVHLHSALNGGWWHFGAWFRAPAGSQDSRFMGPPGNKERKFYHDAKTALTAIPFYVLFIG